MSSGPRRTDRTRWRTFAHLVPAVIYPVIGTYLAVLVATNNPPGCVYQVDYLPAWWLFVAGLAGLVVGRNVSVLFAPSAAPRRLQDPPPALTQLALVLLFLLLTAVWVLEAIGTSHVAANGLTFEPITYYVRCAISHDLRDSPFHLGLFTIGIVFVICFTAGHWLWDHHKDSPRGPETMA